MKKIIARIATGLLTVLLFVGCGEKKGHVDIQLPADFKGDQLVVSHVYLNNIFSAKQQDDITVLYDTLKVVGGKTSMELDSKETAWYCIESPVLTTMSAEFYAEPSDKLTVNIKSFEPLDYSVTGSELMDDLTAFSSATVPVRMKYVELLRASDDVDPVEAKKLLDAYDAAVRKFVTDNPESPAVPLAITELSGDDFKTLYDAMTPKAKASILMPYAEMYNRDVESMLKDRKEEADRKAEVASGTITAPGFTLPDLDGKMVSLADFRGKWVVLDFWGSWCGWCIKGFPALKEAYKKYGDKITVISIDCNESEEEWREGVKKHQLPWMNLYNGHDKALYEAYNIEGFPTKAIINPEGKLVDLTTGEDPSFFDRLAGFVGQ